MNAEGPAEYDLCVIGGGINGAGIARDAAGRGLTVLLVEAQDLAGATSSSSTKLIHGGLRYLEYRDFKLVRESLRERETLLNLAPHVIEPMRFVLPHTPDLRPAWMIRAGLFLYDHMGGRRSLKASRRIDLARDLPGQDLKEQYKTGFAYSDAWADDARLVVLNAMDAAERGARVMTRTACVGLTAARSKQFWHVQLRNLRTGHEAAVTARAVVNATGPWAASFLEGCRMATSDTPRLRLVKGSHVIVPRACANDEAYILQQPDRRIVFVIPYEKNFTLIGTTEVAFTGDPSAAAADEAEVNYLLGAFNLYFRKKLLPAHVVWTYSGVRPLFDESGKSATANSREHHLLADNSRGPLLLSVFGGKLTTFRKVAEQTVNRVLDEPAFRYKRPWTANAPLPGGDFPHLTRDDFIKDQLRRYPWLDKAVTARYARLYGTRMNVILDKAKSAADLGAYFGDGVYESEIRYLIEHEWARTPEDVLWRRTKLGLHVSEDTAARIAASPLFEPERAAS